MQYSIAFNAQTHTIGALLVQDSAGAVRPAGAKEILAAIISSYPSARAA